MIKTLCIVSVLATLAAGASVETTFENTNFALSLPLEGERELYNFNRFRITSHAQEGNWFATAIGDVKNHLGQDALHAASFQAASKMRSDTPFSTQSGTFSYGEGEMYAQLYRLYGGYADERHRFSVGLQKVSMGVGRIWNPTDLFNPKNPLALEPDEVYGAFGAAYTYSPGELSQITAVAAQRADHSLKYAGRIKGFFGFGDAGIDAVYADDIAMIGYEVEGELFNSGIELRSEGGWFDDKLLDRRYFQGIVGADYGFENSAILALEWLHTSETFEHELALSLPSGSRQNLVRSRDYIGMSGGYQVDPLLYGSLNAIVNREDGSYYLSPSFRYSLDNDLTLLIGAMVYGGKKGSEFGGRGETGYLNLKITF